MSIVILDVNSLLLGLGICISYFPLCFTVPCQHVSGRAPTPGPCGLLPLGIWCLGNVWLFVATSQVLTHVHILPGSHWSRVSNLSLVPFLIFLCKIAANPLFALTWGSGLWLVKLQVILCSANQTWTSVMDHCSNGQETSVNNWTQFQI